MAASREADTSTELAYVRTAASFERTMQAWIRTSTSLITFGFAVYKFFQIDAPANKRNYLIGSREFGEILIGLGLITLISAAFDYNARIRALRKKYPPIRASVLSLGVSAALGVLGAVALIAIVLRR